MGKFPILFPGESFEYRSLVIWPDDHFKKKPTATVDGKEKGSSNHSPEKADAAVLAMRGSFQMMSDDGSYFDANVMPFPLRIPPSDRDFPANTMKDDNELKDDKGH